MLQTFRPQTSAPGVPIRAGCRLSGGEPSPRKRGAISLRSSPVVRLRAAAPRGHPRRRLQARDRRAGLAVTRVGRRVDDVARREAFELQLGVRPGGGACSGRQQIVDGLEQALPLRPFVRPEVHTDLFTDGGQARVGDQVERRVVPAARTRQFLGLAAVRRDLRVDSLRTGIEDGLPREAPVAGGERETGDLHVHERAVVVLGGRLLLAEGRVDQPVQEVLVPGPHPRAVTAGPARGSGAEDREGVKDAGVLLREVDDPDGTALVLAGDELPMVEVRVHPGRGVDEPGPQNPRRVLRVLLLARVVPGQAERGGGVEDLPDVGTVGAGVDLGVPLAVALDVRTAPGVGVGLRL